MRRRSLALTVLCALPWAAVAAAQDEPAPGAGETGFAEAVEVQVVNVEVWVTDKKGNPVRDLKRSDFEILEDGRPVPITNFYQVEEGRPVVPAASGRKAPKKSAEPGAERAAAPPLPDSQRLYVIVYVDNFNIRPFNRNRVFTRLRHFLREGLDRGVHVMLVTYDRVLNVRHPFTNDPLLVASALFELETMTGHALSFDSERREVLETLDQTDSPQRALSRVRQFAESSYSDLRFTVDALKELIDSLAGLEGRKALVYVSDGLPMTAGEDLFHAVEAKFPGSGGFTMAREYDGARHFQQLTHKANENRVSFYTIDAAGLRVSPSIGVQNRVSGTAGMMVLSDSLYISNLQSPLRMLADETGGRVVLNTNDVGPDLMRIAADLGSYYSLGYSPPRSGGDGRYHRIEVKVRRKGLRVRHRQGYRAKSAETRMTEGTLSTLHYGFGSNPLGIGLEFGSGQPREDRRVVVPVVVRIPIGKVTLVPREEVHVGRVRVFVSAMDEEGGLSDVQNLAVPIEIPDEQLESALEQDFYYRMDLMMRAGGHRVAVGVRDEIAATVSFVRRTFQVGAG